MSAPPYAFPYSAPTGPLTTSSRSNHCGFHNSNGLLPLALVRTNPSISMRTFRTPNGERRPLLRIWSLLDPPVPRVSIKTPGIEFKAS